VVASDTDCFDDDDDNDETDGEIFDDFEYLKEIVSSAS
tara:strand:- start:263 stop:376 length:114 start_codon:yes stop_codon:yes gene_type:complete